MGREKVSKKAANNTHVIIICGTSLFVQLRVRSHITKVNFGNHCSIFFLSGLDFFPLPNRQQHQVTDWRMQTSVYCRYKRHITHGNRRGDDFSFGGAKSDEKQSRQSNSKCNFRQ